MREFRFSPKAFLAQRGQPSTLLLAVLIITLAALALRHTYYRWALAGPEIEVVVYCHTRPLRTEDLRVVVCYDKLALSPVARGLGLYQNRAPVEVKSYAMHRVAEQDIEFRPYAVRLSHVPRGPISKIYFAVPNGRFYVDVPDRSLKNGVLYVSIDGAPRA